jgi:hypothetical protein
LSEPLIKRPEIPKHLPYCFFQNTSTEFSKIERFKCKEASRYNIACKARTIVSYLYDLGYTGSDTSQAIALLETLALMMWLTKLDMYRDVVWQDFNDEPAREKLEAKRTLRSLLSELEMDPAIVDAAFPGPTVPVDDL